MRELPAHWLTAALSRATIHGGSYAVTNAQANDTERNFGQAEKQSLLTLYQAPEKVSSPVCKSFSFTTLCWDSSTSGTARSVARYPSESC
jgi:hypothetical protein